jgi:shikimate kinase
MTKQTENVVLIGFMGTGKTAIGKRLSTKLDYRFIDTDAEIETATGLKIPEIFKKYGERRFRAEERIAIQKASSCRGAVIATGGGVVLSRENMQALRQGGLIVLLESRPEVISKRVRHHDVRPLLSRSSQLETQIEELLAERAPFYADYDLKIDTSDLSFEEVIDEILSYLQQQGWELEGVNGE